MSTDAGVLVPIDLFERGESDDERVGVALLHFRIGLETFSAGLPVDWAHVAYRMARALVEADELEPERQTPADGS